MLFDAEPEVFDGFEEAVFSAILQTRQLLHVHSERIYLMGCGEGAAVAYWLGPDLSRAVRGRGGDQWLVARRACGLWAG